MLIKEISLNACPSTSILAGLNKQLIEQLGKIAPGKLVDISDLGASLIDFGPAANPFVGGPTAKARLKEAITIRGQKLVVNSAYRTVAQQFLLWRMFNLTSHGCGMAAVANPGASNHESGLALDVQDPFSWRLAMQTRGWRHLGPFDPPHYDFVGGTDLRTLGVWAFQALWTKHHPGDDIDDGGDWGPITRDRLERTPVDGF